MERSRYFPLLGLIGLNLLLRGLWLVWMHPPQQMDFLWYYTHAVDMAEGRGYVWGGHPTAYWPIGYPFFLSVLFRVTGPSVIAGLMVNALLSVGMVLLVYALTLQIWRRRAVALAAGLAYTLLPSGIEWNAALGSEELFTFLLLLALWLYVRSTPTLVAGVLLGLACDVRPIPLLFPLCVLAYERFIARRSTMQAFRQSSLLFAGMLLGIAPVTIRNALVMHHFIPISTNGGVNLWQGTHSDSAYFWSWDPRVNPLLRAGSNEVLENQIGVHAFLTYALQHPLQLVFHAVAKWFFLYWVDWNVVDVTFATRWRPHTWPIWLARGFDTGVYWLWMGLTAAGLHRTWRTWRRRGRRAAAGWWPLLYVVYNTLVFSVFPAWDRFRFPIMPFLAVYVGLGAGMAARWLRRRWRRRTRAASDGHSSSGSCGGRRRSLRGTMSR